MQDLILDSNIRDYVLIPMVVAVFIFGIVRFYLTKLMSSPAEGNEAQKLLKPVELQEFEEFPKAETLLAEAEKETVYRLVVLLHCEKWVKNKQTK